MAPRWCSTARRVAEAQTRCEQILAERGLTLVHPYDDARIIAGQGTIALEMLEEVPDLDVLVIPIGGGGLIAGNAIAARADEAEDRDRRRRSRALSVGVERAARREPADRRGDAGRRHRGQECRQADAADDPRTGRPRSFWSTRRIWSARSNAYLTLQKTMAEGAGAAGLAAMLAKPERFRGKKVGLILCGGNIDPRILASIMVRELERESRIVSFRLTIPDRPGVLGVIATRLGELGANILEVDHRRLFLDVPAKGAKLDVTIETRDAAHAADILAALTADGYQPVRIETGAAME